jgi:magnesium chelatase family protein
MGHGQIVTVEIGIADGLPAYVHLGLPDAALTESRDRARSAMVNCSEKWPNRKVNVSLPGLVAQERIEF